MKGAGAATRAPNPGPPTATRTRASPRGRGPPPLHRHRRIRGLPRPPGAPPGSLAHHLGRVVVHGQMEAAETGVRQRSEAEGDEHGPDADLAAEQDADNEHAALEDGADDPEPVAAGGDRRHEAVAGAGPEPRPDVEATAQSEAEQRDHEER